MFPFKVHFLLRGVKMVKPIYRKMLATSWKDKYGVRSVFAMYLPEGSAGASEQVLCLTCEAVLQALA